MVNGGCKCEKPNKGARLQLVTKRKTFTFGEAVSPSPSGGITPSVVGSEIQRSLVDRSVVYPIVYGVLPPSQVVVWDF